MRVRIDGTIYTLDDAPVLEKNKKHSLDLVVDRLVAKEGIRTRLADALELAIRYGEGRVILHTIEKHHISDIIVVDDAGRVRGLVDAQDLPGLKLM